MNNQLLQRWIAARTQAEATDAVLALAMARREEEQSRKVRRDWNDSDRYEKEERQ